MDPESLTFQPRDDIWRVQTDMIRVQQSQAELSDRVSRLERRQDDDSRLKNVWGTSSPFPSVLGGTPQQIPLQQPTAEHFSNFDNLQLDADEEPRRIGATSRANSVRFDETANHGHWAHASRSSLDLISRTGSGLGGHAMSERSYSHKSDGRHSSAGHSVASGRANSLTGLGPILPAEPPGLAPGLFILGSVPAIIRCWLDTDFKHDTLLYAAVCSGSFASYLDFHLVDLLGLRNQLTTSGDGTHKVKMSVYLPEAVPVLGSSRSNSPAPQLPSVAVEFTVIEEYSAENNPKAIQIFLGSDTLRAHNADLLFSTNQLTLYDDDRTKLQIPLVRPEDARTFRSLSVTSRPRLAMQSQGSANRTDIDSHESAVLSSSTSRDPDTAMSKRNGFGTATSSEDGGTNGPRSLEQRPLLGLATSIPDDKDAHDSSPTSAAPRTGPSPAIWSNWRRDSAEKTNTGNLDWANVGKTTSSSASHKPRDMKVLKPIRSTSRPHSTSTSSPGAGQSRFFDDGKRRGENETPVGMASLQVKRTVSGDKGKENILAATKPRSANPVGGASAFAWLNSGASK